MSTTPHGTPALPAPPPTTESRSSRRTTSTSTASAHTPATTGAHAAHTPGWKRAVSTLRPYTVLILLLATILIGGLLRYLGIFWGLPMQLHADEWVVIEYAIDLAQRNSFEPQFFARPDHLEIQLSYIAYEIWARLFHGELPEVLYETNQAPFYAISRAITATFGTLMIPLAYAIGRPIARGAGLVMAIAVAIYPPFVEHSRYATPDVPVTFTVMLVILGCVLYLRSGRWWPLVLASAGVALGITAKYPAGVSALAIAAVVVIVAVRARKYWQILSRGAAAIGMVLGFTFILSPVLFTNMSEVIRQLTGQNSDGHLGASGLGWGGNLAFYATDFAGSAGLIVVLFAVVGVMWAIRARRGEAVPIAIGLVYWVVISALSLHWSRWGLPMYLTGVLFAALGVYGAWMWVRSRDTGRTRTIGSWIVGVLAAISGLALLLGSISQVAYARATDTRAAATADLEALGVTTENTVYDGYTPFMPNDPNTVATELEVVDGVVRHRTADFGAEYVLTSSIMSNRYLRDDTRPEHEVYVALEEIPATQTWSGIGDPPSGMWEIPRILTSIGYLAKAADGGLVGPRLVLRDLP